MVATVKKIHAGEIQKRLSKKSMEELKEMEKEGYDTSSFQISMSVNDVDVTDFKPSGNYYQVRFDYIDQFELSIAEKCAVFTLIKYISYDPKTREGIQQLKHIGKDDPLSQKDLEVILECSKAQVERIMSKLVECNIVAKNKSGRRVTFFLNPLVAFKGVTIDRTLKDMFNILK